MLMPCAHNLDSKIVFSCAIANRMALDTSSVVLSVTIVPVVSKLEGGHADIHDFCGCGSRL